MNNKYDLIIVGSSFAGSFFLKKYLEKSQDGKVLVLERGPFEKHSWRLDNRKLMDPSGIVSSIRFQDTFINETPAKPWVYTPAFGGSSNCWWACTPRFLPSDFELKTRYGVGIDWPISYEDIEPYYCDAEDIMSISGSSNHTPFPRSRPYPQPEHLFNNVDRLLSKKYPDSFFHMPAARTRRPTENRPACCASGVCNLCPIDAKFTVINELSHLYDDPRVELRTNSQATDILIEGGLAKGVHYFSNDVEHVVQGETIALAANPIFNAHILLNSGIVNQHLGKYLSEQVAFSCKVNLNGVNNFNGSSSLIGHGYMLYDGPHRSDHAACIIETFNIPNIRTERGQYTQKAYFKFIFDDIPSSENRVEATNDLKMPKVIYKSHSEYADKGIDNAKRVFDKLFDCLPIESKVFSDGVHRTEGHILGTALMGNSKNDSVVDSNQTVHDYSNLFSLGASSFCTVSPANPTLTICALSLRSADRYY
jgi:choline dehydrogenase-like flavoprotein